MARYETHEQAVNRAFKGIRGRRPASKFERGRRQARAFREDTEEAAYRSVSLLAKQTDLARKMLGQLIDPDKVADRLERRNGER